MTDADALLFLCDMLEEGRKFDGVEELRAVFRRDLTECLFAALNHQISYLKVSGAPIDGETEKAYKFLKDKKHE